MDLQPIDEDYEERMLQFEIDCGGLRGCTSAI